MSGQCRPSSFSEARNDIYYPLGETCLAEQFAQAQSRQWSLFGRFEDHRVATSQGRGKLPGGHLNRKVPGNDLTYHAHRLAQSIGEHVGYGNWNGFTLQLCRPSCEITEVISRQRYIGC